MKKNLTFNCAYGQCFFKNEKQSYSFTAVSGKQQLIFALPKNLATDRILSTEGDIMDTCRGLMDILAAAAWEPQLGIALKHFSNQDAFLPTFIGNYHCCLLENTPWDKDELDKLLGLFSPAGAAYFKRITSMLIDCGNMVLISPLNAVVNQ